VADPGQVLHDEYRGLVGVVVANPEHRSVRPPSGI
jgi:hypothetical protein